MTVVKKRKTMKEMMEERELKFVSVAEDISNQVYEAIEKVVEETIDLSILKYIDITITNSCIVVSIENDQIFSKKYIGITQKYIFEEMVKLMNSLGYRIYINNTLISDGEYISKVRYILDN